MQDLFGDVDPNGDAWTQEDNSRELRRLLELLGPSQLHAAPMTTRHAHLQDTGHLLRSGCCSDALAARTDARPTTP